MSQDNYGITADKIGNWTFVENDPTDRTQQKTYKTGKKIKAVDEDGEEIKDDDGNTILIDEEKIILQRSENWTIIRKRKIVGLTKHKPENGETRSSFDLMTGPNSNMSWSSIGRIGTEKKFLCIRDRVVNLNTVLGTSEQTQIWLYIGKWKNIPEGKFK